MGERGARGEREERPEREKERDRERSEVRRIIRCFRIINNFGKPRLIKFYERLTNEQRQKAIDHAYRLVSKRFDDLCNFVEDDKLFGEDTHLIYRHFATLYFIVICDKAESELGILDLIQVSTSLPLPTPLLFDRTRLTTRLSNFRPSLPSFCLFCLFVALASL